MKRTAALKATALAVAIGLIAVAGLAVYFYTAPPNYSGDANAAANTPLTGPLPGGQFITVEYNGASYKVPERGPNSPSFACPVGTDPSVCSLLNQTCGNGVAPAQEPWKTCSNCIFDAGCTGDMSCDPYTHQCSTPATACMVAVYGGG